MQTARQLWKLLTPYRRLLLLLVVVATLVVGAESIGLGFVFLLLTADESTATGLKFSWVHEQVHALLGVSPIYRIYLAAGVLVGITVLRSGLQYAEKLLALRLRRLVEGSLQKQLFFRFHQISLGAYQRERIGVWVTLLGQYTRTVGSLVLQVGEVISDSVILVAYIGVAFFVSWQLTSLSLLLLLPTALLLRPLISARLRAASLVARDLMKETQSVAQDRLRAMKMIRLFGQEAWSQTTYQKQLNTYLVQEYQAAALSALVRPLFSVVNVTLLAIGLLVGVTFLPGIPETILTELLLFLTIALRLMGPMSSVSQFQSKVTIAAPMLQGVLEMIEGDSPLAPANGTLGFPGLCRSIEFKDVSFAYSSEDALALHHINLQIVRGQVTAIVGASGGGKSTLVNLLARLYDPTEGQILVDGGDLRLLDLATWHQKIAVVSQEVTLFHMSVWDNLRFVHEDATDEAVIEAAKQAAAHDFIMELPQGYDTLLQGDGTRLSGGQRQRIALARALLMAADLLVLDEATSELDAMTEQVIRQTVHDYAQTHTVLLIAHRLSNVLQADHIYVMKQGGILEEGTHTELMQNNQFYAQMIQAQQV